MTTMATAGPVSVSVRPESQATVTHTPPSDDVVNTRTQIHTAAGPAAQARLVLTN